MSFMEYTPHGTGISGVYRKDPTVWDPFLEFTHHLMRGPSPLSFAQRELIAAYVSRLSECEYCSGAHGSAAAALGFPAQLQEQIVTDLSGADLAPEFRALLAFVRKVALEPTTITQDDVSKLKEAGWSEVALNHAIGIAARYSMATRISHAHGLVVAADDLEESGKRMAAPDWTCLPEARR